MRISDWSSDVCSSDLEGAPTPVATFFATAPKVAAMGLFVRVAVAAFGGAVADWRQIVIFSSLASIVLGAVGARSEEHTSELQSLMRNSYAVFCLKKKTTNK